MRTSIASVAIYHSDDPLRRLLRNSERPVCYILTMEVARQFKESPASTYQPCVDDKKFRDHRCGALILVGGHLRRHDWQLGRNLSSFTSNERQEFLPRRRRDRKGLQRSHRNHHQQLFRRHRLREGDAGGDSGNAFHARSALSLFPLQRVQETQRRSGFALLRHRRHDRAASRRRLHPVGS